MTALYDGMASVLNDVFGAGVTWTPAGGSAAGIRAVFRESPIEVSTADGGAVLIEEPTLQVPRDVAPGLQAGDRIVTGDGRAWLIQSVIPGGSPAQDAFRLFTLERTA